MKVMMNSVAALKYEVLDARGDVVEQGHEPLVDLHGGILPKVEEALADRGGGRAGACPPRGFCKPLTSYTSDLNTCSAG